MTESIQSKLERVENYGHGRAAAIREFLLDCVTLSEDMHQRLSELADDCDVDATTLREVREELAEEMREHDEFARRHVDCIPCAQSESILSGEGGEDDGKTR